MKDLIIAYIIMKIMEPIMESLKLVILIDTTLLTMLICIPLYPRQFWTKLGGANFITPNALLTYLPNEAIRRGIGRLR